MAVSTTNAVSGPYVANGVTTSFPFTFKLLDAGGARVTLTVGGVETEIAPTEFETVINEGGNGGSVVFGAAPAAGDLRIYSEPEFIQEAAFSSGQRFSPAAVNDALDRAAIRDQYLLRKVDAVLDAVDAGIFGDVRSDLASPAPGKGGALVGFRPAWPTAREYELLTKARQRHDLADFAAPGIGGDYTDALLKAAAAMAGGDVAGFRTPEGVINFETPIIFSNHFGHLELPGRGAARLLYQGSDDTADLIRFENTELGYVKGWSIRNLFVDSATTMSAGAAVRFVNFVQSDIFGLVVGDQDPAKKCFDGIWFDGVDIVHVYNLGSAAGHKGVLVNGKDMGGGVPGYAADLYLHSGKITGCGAEGLHVGGAFGGLNIGSIGIIGNEGDGLLIDHSLVGINNREITAIAGSACDANGGCGVRIADNLGGPGWINMAGMWACSNGSDGFRIESWTPGGRISLLGAIAYNNGRDGLRSQDAGIAIDASAGAFFLNDGFGINDLWGGGNIVVGAPRMSGGNGAGFFGSNGQVFDVPITNERRFLGTLDGSGEATIPHYISAGASRVCPVSASYLDGSGVARMLSGANVAVDNTNIYLLGGAAGRPFTVIARVTE